MTEERKNRLIAAGLAYDEALSRMMGKEELLERVLRKFAADASCSRLIAALEARDFPAAESSAHALKGLAGNVGFMALSSAANDIMTRLRGGQTDDMDPPVRALQAHYRAAMEGLEGL